jgi:DNA-binding MarR family transcriptional regulator
MGLKLTLKSPRDYVVAISGLFVNSRYPNGLTLKEIEIIAALMQHSRQGIITTTVRRKIMKELDLKPQAFYNTMSSLKLKQVIDGEELHRLFTNTDISLHYANSNP